VRFSFDAGDPPALARFWGEILGYVPEPPPDGFASWEDWLVKMKVPEDRWTSVAALVDPEGLRSRVDAEVERLLGLGAVKVKVRWRVRGVPHRDA
jgi:hypothetical protein